METAEKLIFTSKEALLYFGWDYLNISICNLDEEMYERFEKFATLKRNVLAISKVRQLPIY